MTVTQDPASNIPENDENGSSPEGQGAAGTDNGAAFGLQADLEAALVQVSELRDQLLRARADVENTRRRSQDDVSKAHKFGIESFAESMVPVKDSLEAALTQPDQTLEGLRQGVEATLKQLSAAFERNRLLEIAPAAGDKFDPHHHQAISSVPNDLPANAVVQTLQKGYLIVDRVLRPALVVVSASKE
jgi:molecular chaperone GrpE